jgi:membrane protease YdiL (CAAX protease family)
MKMNRILIETLLIMILAVGGMLFLPQLKTVFAFIPVIYVLVERHLRKRSWIDLGFRFSTLWQDFRATWILFVLTGFLIQPLTALLASYLFPQYLEHVLSRLPFQQDINWLVLIPLLAISLLAEEITFRSLFQGRLSPFFGQTAAILLVSFLFGLSHYSPGVFLVVALDIASIFFDSILYGILYARRNNLILVWAAHLAGDILGMIFLLNNMH